MPFNTLKLARKAVQAVTALLLTAALPAHAAWNQLNLPRGVTSASRDAYDLHMLTLWVCTVVGIIVFAVMIYALVRFRKSKGAVAAKFTHSTTAEVIWTILPTLVLIFLAYETAPALIRIEDTRNSEMTIRITGYQWKWQYEYVGQNVAFFSTLAQKPATRHASWVRARIRIRSRTTCLRWTSHWWCRSAQRSAIC